MAIITITGLDKIAHKLKTTEDIARHLGPPMVQSLSHLQRRVARYPRKDPTAFARLATKAQKRAYWARVRSGEINHGKHGYVRTGTLGRKWSHRVRSGNTFVIGSLTNNAGYGVYVMGERRQAFHAASGFKTVDEVAEKEGKAVQGYFNATIRRLLD